MMRLTRLTVHRYRGVAPGTSLAFSRGINVILGRNGTGKTTLLNLIAMIARSDFSLLEGEECHLAFTLEIGDAVVEMELENHPMRRFRYGELPALGWRYQITVDRAGEVAVMEVVDGEVQHASPDLGDVPRGVLQYLRLFEPDLFDGLSFVGSHLQNPHAKAVPARVNAMHAASSLLGLGFPSADAGRFDEGLGLFGRIVDEPPVSWAASTLPQPPQIMVSIGFEDGPDSHGRFCPSQLAERVVEEHVQPGFVEVSAYSDLDIVRRIAAAFDAEQVTVRPRFWGGDANSTAYAGMSFTITLDTHTRITHDALSFGQKRRLAFLWYLASNPQGIVIADELVNGFHHDWVADSIDDIGDRQAFVASQNPLLLDFLAFDSPEDVLGAFVFCSAQPRDDGRRGWRWTNMSPEEAESLHKAIGVGIQHVSGILRTKGLW